MTPSLSVYIATVLFGTCHGFVQNFISSTQIRPYDGFLTNPVHKPIIYYTTKLHMNVVEDFLSGTDKTARKADNDKYLAALTKRVNRINDLEASVEELADDELIGKTNEFRKRLKLGEDINGPILEEAFAVVREAAWYVFILVY